MISLAAVLIIGAAVLVAATTILAVAFVVLFVWGLVQDRRERLAAQSRWLELRSQSRTAVPGRRAAA